MLSATPSPVTIIAFVTRKPGTTLEDFKTYFETRHAPWVISLVEAGCGAQVLPLSYARYYRDDGKAASLPVGPGDYDAVSCVTFRDMQHRDEYLAEITKRYEAIGADEETFMDRSKLKVMTGSDMTW
ncbi:uncharacterized protein PpBr36_09894 [Pyricularia pennisetigena]|uniref:uncharacterized protein n=1 Tax=Pyricularia pennisetigena TaxID=1578925 RepID=UPI001152C755|nr:uncharacterized protein PpBr36_09894 [Pyricularia pennisetigena]TLS22543.1 hypothetical protein PpBr36_09894 [Pyricularia pennisetigena]